MLSLGTDCIDRQMKFKQFLMLFFIYFFVCIFSELPHSPRSLTARLNDSDSRSVLLSWLRPFDGNSPLLYYVLELSENSMYVYVRPWAYFIVPERRTSVHSLSTKH